MTVSLKKEKEDPVATTFSKSFGIPVRIRSSEIPVFVKEFHVSKLVFSERQY